MIKRLRVCYCSLYAIKPRIGGLKLFNLVLWIHILCLIYSLNISIDVFFLFLCLIENKPEGNLLDAVQCYRRVVAIYVNA